MDLEALKDLLDDEKFTELETFVNDLTGQRDQARNESINGRKTMKSELSTLKQQQETLLEKLGVDTFDEVENLAVDAKGAADAVRQYEAKLKRAERERDQATQDKQSLESKYLESKKSSVISKALAAHKFVAQDVIESFVNPRLVWEGDDLFFKQDDGQLVTVKDGVAGIAKSRPELLASTGAGGSGVRSTSVGDSGGQLTMTRAEFDNLPPSKQMEVSKAGVTLQ